MIRTLYVDLARFIDENRNLPVLRVTLHLAIISNYNFHIMYLFVLVQMSPWPLECREEAKMVETSPEKPCEDALWRTMETCFIQTP